MIYLHTSDDLDIFVSWHIRKDGIIQWLDRYKARSHIFSPIDRRMLSPKIIYIYIDVNVFESLVCNFNYQSFLVLVSMSQVRSLFITYVIVSRVVWVGVACLGLAHLQLIELGLQFGREKKVLINLYSLAMFALHLYYEEFVATCTIMF